MKSYRDLKREEFERDKCQTCNGNGTLNDAEPGDIAYVEWLCPDCGGTGRKPENEGPEKDH